ncbi:MAG: OmpH family outer membrane protein [Balneolaceae bacterium]
MGILRKTLLLLTGVSLAASVNLFSQNQKIGFIDSEVIMEQMPEYTGIEQRLNLLSESWREELKRMDAEIEEMEEEFEAREVLFTDDIREQRRKEIEDKIRRREQFLEEKFGPEGEYFQRQNELLEPIQRQVFDAINRVANREEFDFVFDRAEDARFLFANPEWNLNREVMLELGMEPNEQGN